jgi:hypothetical protein
MMSGHIARNQIQEGYRWEELLRNSILNPDDDSLKIIIQSTVSSYLASSTKKKSNRSCQIEKNAPTLKRSDRLRAIDDYNQSKRTDVHLDRLLKAHTTLMTRRDKVLRKLKRSNSIPSISLLDHLYLDVFLVPQEYAERREHQMQRKNTRELARPGHVRISVLTTPVGPYSYLKVAGKYFHRKTRASHIVRLLKDKSKDKLSALDGQIQLATAEARWEKRMGDDRNIQILIAEWTTPLLQQRKKLIVQMLRERRKLLNYRQILMGRKIILDRLMKRKYEANALKWANYRPQVLHEGRIFRMSHSPIVVSRRAH